MAQIITSREDGLRINVKPANGKFFTLDEIQWLVSTNNKPAYFQHVPLQRNSYEFNAVHPFTVMLCDEEGLVHGEDEKNEFATSCSFSDIYGNVLICNTDSEGEYIE